MIKRSIDVALSLIGLIILAPLFILVLLLIWINDFQNPLYVPSRIGKNNKKFKMVKLRSMLVDADKSGVDSTSKYDPRITKIGHFIRKFKLDELSQLLNVLKGDMSLVGPRPNVERETQLYTDREKKILDVRPGITDFASIIFSDEADILSNQQDPDIAYNQLIRPWKSRLAILYVNKKNLLIDVGLIIATIISIISRKNALKLVNYLLKKITSDKELINFSKRKTELKPTAPPGMETIVTNRFEN